MGPIDYYAYLSKLRFVEPTQKIILTLGTLGFCLFGNSILVYCVVMIVMGYLTIGVGKTPWRLFLKCRMIPFSFLVLSLVTIIFEIGIGSHECLWQVQFFSTSIGFTKIGLQRSGLLFLKVMASLNALYFLSLSTPITDFLKGLENLRCPQFLIELMALIYRFIFVLMDQVVIMHHAQESRLGYKNMRVGVRSLGVLLSTLLLQALKINDQLYTALEARGYKGQLHVLNPKGYKKVAYSKIIGLQCVYLGCIVLEKWLLWGRVI